MELNVRLQILKDAGQISEETFDSLQKVIELFKEEWNIKLTEENGSMLITHLCSALERIKRGEVIEGIESDIYQEIKNHPKYEQGSKLVSVIGDLSYVKIPESEKTFIMMHLCTLFESN